MYKYFKTSELTCSHCGADGMDEGFMHKIDALREELNFPFKISSAYRCPKHPVEASKASPGAHTEGRAIDIRVYGSNALKLVEAGIRRGMAGIGISQKGSVALRFIHLDDLPLTEDGGNRPRPWIWSY